MVGMLQLLRVIDSFKLLCLLPEVSAPSTLANLLFNGLETASDLLFFFVCFCFLFFFHFEFTTDKVCNSLKFK